jgi:putative membrane protein
MGADSSPSGTTAPGAGADVTRRTHLANERTYLAWWRTGLGSLAAGVAAGRLVPVLTHSASWPYAILGIGFAILGIVCVVYAYIRHRQVERALARGEFAPPDNRVVAGLAVGGALLGVIVVAMIAVQS